MVLKSGGLVERLERLGYERVRGRRPSEAGEFFWGHDRFWIYRRGFQHGNRRHPARLLELGLRREDGRVLSVAVADGDSSEARLEPELLTESLSDQRAPRRPLQLDHLPDHVWQTVLAAEDSRFFDHGGLDSRAIARAMLKNARAGRVTQGGSTITQQLVKVRDLTPKRSLGRKVSEAFRALALEAEYPKEEILETYLNHVYFGHVDGVGVYGLGAAARTYYSKSVYRLSLSEAAVLAGIIQGPNGRSPERHPQRALERQRYVLDRMEDLEWAGKEELARIRRAGLPPLRLSKPTAAGPRAFSSWLREAVKDEAPKRAEEGRGVVIESTLDPWLQERAEAAVATGLADLRKNHRRLRGKALSAALVTLDAQTGAALAYVGGDPKNRGDAFDRARNARRQPGSAVKPLILLEAFDDCGRRAPLYPARAIADEALTLDLPSGPWEPRNPDGRFRGPVTLRQATVASLNIPFIRLARWCGFEATANRLRKAGLEIPDPAPPAFVLGAVETTPRSLAEAYTPVAAAGRGSEAVPYRRLAKPGGRTLDRGSQGVLGRGRRVADAASAYLVQDVLKDALGGGERRGSLPPSLQGRAWAKSGTSSDQRDAWFVGGAGSVVTAVWVGVDDDTPLGLFGSSAARPIWQELMVHALGAHPAPDAERPRDIVERWVEEGTGLLLQRQRPGAVRDLFRRGNEPQTRRWFRSEDPLPVLR